MSVPRNNEPSPVTCSRAEVWPEILELRAPPQIAVNVSAMVTVLVPQRVSLSTTRMLEEQPKLRGKIRYEFDRASRVPREHRGHSQNCSETSCGQSGLLTHCRPLAKLHNLNLMPRVSCHQKDVADEAGRCHWCGGSALSRCRRNLDLTAQTQSSEMWNQIRTVPPHRRSRRMALLRVHCQCTCAPYRTDWLSTCAIGICIRHPLPL